MFDSILVPVDGSDAATAAADGAISLARTFDATVSLLAVVEPTPLPFTDVPDDPGRDALDDRTTETLGHVESQAVEAGVSSTTTVERGTPEEEIVDHAETTDLDLIAMGTHGRSELKHYLLGSVAERVLRTTPVPVLTMRASDELQGLDTILVPTDGSECAQRAASRAFILASQHDADVQFLSVVDTQTLAAGYEAGSELPTYVQLLEKRRKEALEDLREQASYHHVDYETELVEGDPARVIRDHASESDVDLVSMGLRGNDTAEGSVFGTVTDRVVRSDTVPVLASPVDDD